METVSIHQQMVWVQLISVLLVPLMLLFYQTKVGSFVMRLPFGIAHLLSSLRTREYSPVQQERQDDDQDCQRNEESGYVDVPESAFHNATKEARRCQGGQDSARHPPEPAISLSETPNDYRQAHGHVNAGYHSTGEQSYRTPRVRSRRAQSQFTTAPRPTYDGAPKRDREQPMSRFMNAGSPVTTQGNRCPKPGNSGPGFKGR